MNPMDKPYTLVQPGTKIVLPVNKAARQRAEEARYVYSAYIATTLTDTDTTRKETSMPPYLYVRFRDKKGNDNAR